MGATCGQVDPSHEHPNRARTRHKDTLYLQSLHVYTNNRPDSSSVPGPPSEAQSQHFRTFKLSRP